MAGIGYALAYERTARLEMSVLTHFGLNTVHFLLFYCPALALKADALHLDMQRAPRRVTHGRGVQ